MVSTTFITSVLALCAAVSAQVVNVTKPIGPFAMKISSASKEYNNKFITKIPYATGVNLVTFSDTLDSSFYIAHHNDTQTGRLVYLDGFDDEYNPVMYDAGFFKDGRYPGQSAVFLGGQVPVPEFNIIRGQQLGRNGQSGFLLCRLTVPGAPQYPILAFKEKAKFDSGCAEVTLYLEMLHV